jgi:predicted AlkP superfamily pyrophosphatase or phosphodiesterase
MPTLMQMRREGAGTWQAFTVVPSITLISHTSMLTGVQPDKHLIDWNDWKPEKGLVQVPTVFALAKVKGLTTALFAGKEKFKHLNVPNTVDSFDVPEFAAKTVAETAAQCITEKKPNLCFIHFADSDGAGHKFGWGSPEQKQAFADVDAALKVIRDAIDKAGIANDSVIIISADHGGHDKTHGSTRLEDMHIPWIVWGKGVKRDFEITKRVSTCDTAATALWLLGVPLPESMDGKPVASAFR